MEQQKPDSRSLNEAIRLAHRGDSGAFEFIYRSHCGFVQSICLRMLRNPVEAEDVAQETFVQVFRKIHTFRGESAFSSWLYRLTTNLVLMRFRKKNYEQASLDELLGEEEDGGFRDRIGGPDLHLSGLFDRLELQSAIDLLPVGYKEVLILHDVVGYNHKEIGNILRFSAGNSKSQLHKARKRLRGILRDTKRRSLRHSLGIARGPLALSRSN